MNLKQLQAEARRMEESKLRVSTWLAQLPERRRRALEEGARLKGYATVERLGVELLDRWLDEADKQRARRTTRAVLTSPEVVDRFGEAIAAKLRAIRTANWVRIDKGTGEVSAHASHPGSVSGVVVLDWREPTKPGAPNPRDEARDTEGEITPESVAAWLLGRPRPEPKIGG